MQRTLFIVVAAVAVLLAIGLFGALRSRGTAAAPAGVDPTELVAGARFILGSAEAKVTVVDFSNYLCPHCRDHALEVFPLIQRDYIDTGKVRYVFRDFPFGAPNNPQPPVVRAGEAAACAADATIDKYVTYHEALFRAQQQWGGLPEPSLTRYLVDLAGQIGLAPASFENCLNSGQKRAGVLADRALADKLRLSGTPTFFINATQVSGTMAYDDWKTALDEALEGKTPTIPERNRPTSSSQ
ncbi:DsbA family protein [Calidithermus timidus]|uniref:DsbA family protein n=1 Tax=Calidithermus timidus TaxID=307124 RepID=UPI00037B8098|nr:thioredoxin domain-containing protein [Calidithermus timidus]